MKRILPILWAAVMTLAVSSCASKSDIKDLQSQINGLSSGKIATIEQQINSVQSSISRMETTSTELKSFIETLQKQVVKLNEADETLSKSISDLKADLENKVDAEKSSLLSTLEAYKKDVAAQLATVNASLKTLQVKDTDLQKQITELKKYVDDGLKTTKDWASATFATLSQHNDLCEMVAGIQTNIEIVNKGLADLEASSAADKTALTEMINALSGKTTADIAAAVDKCNSAISTAKKEITAAYEKAIKEAISSLETSMKSWVSSQLSGYYTIAQMDAQVSALQAQLDAMGDDSDADETKITEVEGKLSQLTQDLETAKETIKKEYEAAISQAIQQNAGVLTAQIQEKINTVNSTITALTTRVTTLETTIGILTGRLDAAEQSIATITQQITAINSSISDLGSIRQTIQELITAKTAQGEDITALKAADQTLEGKITELKTYVNTELAKYATTEWANATFATLAKQAEILADVAKLKSDLGVLDQQLETAISSLETSMKNWVNTQLSGYYTIAQMDAQVAALQAQLDDLGDDADADETKITELEGALSQLTQDLATAKATIKTEYEAAISQAIQQNTGTLTTQIQEKINTVNSTITALTTRVTALETDVTNLKADVDALKAMIQTVSIIPAYNDGSVMAESGILTINCIITPKKAVASLAKNNFTVLTSEVLTKGGLYGTIAIAEDEDLVLDENNGTATVKVDVSSVMPTEEGKALCVALNIKTGLSDYTTEFVPVTATILKPEAVDLGLPSGIKWASFNLGATKPEEFGEYYQWAGMEDVASTSISLTNANCPYHTNSYSYTTDWTKYVPSDKPAYWSGSGNPDNKTVLDLDDDIAYQTLGSKWRMPEYKDWKELLDTKNCDWTWTTIGDVSGYKVTSKKSGYTDKWIFLPVAGFRYDTSLSDTGSKGGYWSSSLGITKPECAYGLTIDATSSFTQFYDRFYGLSVRPVSTEGIAPSPTLPEGALSGKFSVSATKQVNFSKGNLVATIDASGAPTAWKFSANQYDCLEEGGANKTIGSAAGDVDLFGWSTESNTYGITTSTSSNTDYSGDFVDWGKNLDNKGTWRTLTAEEWQYLFSYDGSGSDGANYDNATRRGRYKYGVTVCGKTKCVVLAPDDWDLTANPLQDTYGPSSTPMTWEQAEAAGLVCLPAARSRWASDISTGVAGYYWSSSANNDYLDIYGKAVHRLLFDNGDVRPDVNGYIFIGHSVRLVTDSGF